MAKPVATLKEHRALGIDLFNLAWKLLRKKKRSREEDDRMLHTAHASRLHWELSECEPVNLARGEWQISRVYAILGRGEPALHHGWRCKEICEQHGIGDFDLAFAYEAIARACAVIGTTGPRDQFLASAREAAAKIAKKEDRALVLKDLSTIPGAR